MSGGRPQLDYAPTVRWHRRARARRAMIAATVLFLLLISIKWVKPAWQHARLLYWQDQCMGHRFADGAVVYDANDPRRRADDSGLLIVVGAPTPGPATVAPGASPPAPATAPVSESTTATSARVGSTFHSGDPVDLFSPIGSTLPAWDRFYEIYSPPGRRSAATLFVHGLRNSQGERRLVAVDVFECLGHGTAGGPGVRRWTDLDIHVIEPGGLWSKPQLLKNLQYALPIARDAVSATGKFGPRAAAPPVASTAPPLKLYGGQPDPADPSHFTIPYEYAGRPGTLDGFLKADDSVVIEPRERIVTAVRE